MARIDTALGCLVRIAAHYSLPADMHQLERAYIVDENGVDTVGLIRAARDLGLKARRFENIPVEHLAKMPHPSVCRMDNNTYVVLLGSNKDGNILVYDPGVAQQGWVTPEKFGSVFSGEIILFTKRFQVEKLQDKIKSFGFSWFIPVVSKYKTFLSKVLFISLILQLFGLLIPFFTQTIIDRVLVI